MIKVTFFNYRSKKCKWVMLLHWCNIWIYVTYSHNLYFRWIVKSLLLNSFTCNYKYANEYKCQFFLCCWGFLEFDIDFVKVNKVLFFLYVYYKIKHCKKLTTIQVPVYAMCVDWVKSNIVSLKIVSIWHFLDTNER